MSRTTGNEQCPRCSSRGHDSRGDNLVVYDDGGKHCFACGLHVFPKHYSVRSIREPVRTENKAILPYDFTEDVPARAWKWLLQYGMPMSHWRGKVGWSEHHQRLVFLVGHPLQFSIGRYIPPEGAVKAPNRPVESLTGGWIGQGSLEDINALKRAERKWYVWGDSHAHAELWTAPDSRVVVLVEDIVSANKVQGVGHSSTMALFGTNPFHPAFLWALRQGNLPIILWLDKDQELPMRATASRLELLTGCIVVCVTTERDPKELSEKIIQKTLDNALEMC